MRPVRTPEKWARIFASAGRRWLWRPGRWVGVVTRARRAAGGGCRGGDGDGRRGAGEAGPDTRGEPGGPRVASASAPSEVSPRGGTAAATRVRPGSPVAFAPDARAPRARGTGGAGRPNRRAIMFVPLLPQRPNNRPAQCQGTNERLVLLQLVQEQFVDGSKRSKQTYA